MFKRFLKPERIILDNIEFSIKYSVRKNMRRMLLRVVNTQEIRISLPKRLFTNVNAFILEHKIWILEQHRQIKVPFSKDSSFYFKAQRYSVSHHDAPLCLVDTSVFLHPERAKRQTDGFYKKEAKSYLPQRVDFFREKMGMEMKGLRFHCSKRKWGSCNSKKIITLSPYMMKLNDEMIDYIIVHELAHLKHLNHSKEFYDLVHIYIPEYKRIQKEISSLSSVF
jgi:predicted metal-dependent hydrolase